MTKASNLPPPMTLAELLALPAAMDLETAAAGLRMTYAMARRLVSEGKFPLEPMEHSGRYRLYKHVDLLRYLGLDADRLLAAAVGRTAA